MAQLNITIVRADTNGAYDVELPDDEPVEALLAEIIREIGLPRSDARGEHITYEISSKRTGELVMDGTLASKGVKDGDCLLLTSTFVAGGSTLTIDFKDEATALAFSAWFLDGGGEYSFLETEPEHAEDDGRDPVRGFDWDRDTLTLRARA